jgi:hypothetical protein
MRKFILFTLILGLFISCEKYTTNISDLTLSGKYVVSKMSIISTSHAITKDSTYLSNTIFRDSTLPHPFNYIKINDFYMHFDYASVRMNWIKRTSTGSLRDMWEYGEAPNEIFYYRIPYSYNAYDLGTIQFDYIPTNQKSYRRITLHVDSDLPESLQLSGFDFAPYGKNGPRYKIIFSLTRVGP